MEIAAPPRPHTAYWRERAMRGYTYTHIHTDNSAVAGMAGRLRLATTDTHIHKQHYTRRGRVGCVQGRVRAAGRAESAAHISVCASRSEERATERTALL